jgi:hypothetical protein
MVLMSPGKGKRYLRSSNGGRRTRRSLRLDILGSEIFKGGCSGTSVAFTVRLVAQVQVEEQQ